MPHVHVFVRFEPQVIDGHGDLVGKSGQQPDRLWLVAHRDRPFTGTIICRRVMHSCGRRHVVTRSDFNTFAGPGGSFIDGKCEAVDRPRRLVDYALRRMMKSMVVYIDEELIDIQSCGLGLVLQEAKKHLAASGRVVIEVEVDGRQLEYDALAELERSSIDESEVRLTSADPRDVAVAALCEVRKHLASTKQDHHLAAEMLQQDNQAEAVGKIASLVTVWQRTHRAVIESSALMGVDVGMLTVGEQTAEDVVGTLAEHLKTLRDLLQARDTVGLSDVLLYEWPEVIARWDLLVGALMDQIEGVPNGNQRP